MREYIKKLIIYHVGTTIVIVFITIPVDIVTQFSFIIPFFFLNFDCFLTDFLKKQIQW